MNRSYADYTFQFLSSSNSPCSTALDQDTVVLYTDDQTRAIWALKRGREDFQVAHRDMARKMVRSCEVINGFMSRNISLVERTGTTNRGSAVLCNDPYPPTSIPVRSGVRRRQGAESDVGAKRVHYHLDPDDELMAEIDRVLLYAHQPRERLAPDLDLLTSCVPHSERHVTMVWAIYEQYVECTSSPLQRIAPIATSRPIDHLDTSMRKLFRLRSAQEIDRELGELEVTLKKQKRVADRQRQRTLASHILQYIVQDQMRIVGVKTGQSFVARPPHVYITDISVDRPTNKHPDAFALAIVFNLMKSDDVYSHPFCQLESQLMPKSALVTVLQDTSVTNLFQNLAGEQLTEAWNRYIAILDVLTDRRQPDMLKQAPIDASSLTMFRVEPYDHQGRIHTYVVPVAYKHPENGFTIRLNESMSTGCIIRWSSIRENPPERDFYKDMRVRALLVREEQSTFVDGQAVRALAYEGNVEVEIVLAWMYMPENHQRYFKPELAQFPQGFGEPTSSDDRYYLDETGRKQVEEVVLKCVFTCQEDSIHQIHNTDDGRVIVFGMTNREFAIVPRLENEPLATVLQTMHEVVKLLTASDSPLLKHMFGLIDGFKHPQTDIEHAFDILEENFFADMGSRSALTLLSKLARLYFDKRSVYEAISTTYKYFWKDHVYSSGDTIGDVLILSANRAPPPCVHEMWLKRTTNIPLVHCLVDDFSILLLEAEGNQGPRMWRWRSMADFEPTEGDDILGLLLRSEASIDHPKKVINQLSKDPELCIHVLHQAVQNRQSGQQAIRDMAYMELPRLMNVYGARFKDSDSAPIMLTTKTGNKIAQRMRNRVVDKIFLGRTKPYDKRHDRESVFNFGDLTYRVEGEFKFVRKGMNVIGYATQGGEQHLVMVCSHLREKVNWADLDHLLYCFFISYAPMAFVVTSADDGEDLLRIMLMIGSLERLLLPKGGIRQHILTLCGDMDKPSMDILHALLPSADQPLPADHFSIQLRDWVEGTHMHESAYRQVISVFTSAVYLFNATHLNHHLSLSPYPSLNSFPIKINNYLSWEKLLMAGGKYTLAHDAKYALYSGLNDSAFEILFQTHVVKRQGK